ncbi:transaldolase [Aspergillus steynii IBT 23096]|uniref:Transaldolase n=1 Tax=Aspergillus steynii IBT 23096 TaxID=1392250 RepID=A0A2I2FZI9_9EURO|nr:transaldolase [Aspergillus steynii IBT 23096]PLB45986.1 transaldolase [Aspergillus steynii IBT 23096]
MATQTGLDVLRKRTIVDCDTMDEQVAKKMGPFQDCTSNQAIAYGELSKPEHAGLISASVADAKALLSRFPGLSVEELAVEIAMVQLALKIAPHIRGHVHIQTNPYYSYSTEKTIVNALRIVQLFQHFQPGFEQSRICIKIPSTWEGMLACRTLEKAGVRTLATTLFTMAQAVLAAEVGCTYVAPYVNQLKVHFEPGFTDPNKLLPLCVLIQKYYESIQAKTQVLPASLTSTNDIFALAGVQHLTIAPGLLEELSQPGSVPVMRSLFDTDVPAITPASTLIYLNDEPAYRLAFTRDLHGASEEKLTQAVNIFCDMQDKLVQVMKANL